MNMYFVPIDENITFIQSESGGKFPYSNSLLIQDERTVLIGYGFIDEGIACYVFP